MHDRYVVVGKHDEIGPGTLKRAVVKDVAVQLTNVNGTVYAVHDLCTHEDSSLSPGCLKGELVSCILHGSRFSVITGEPREEPACGALHAWLVRVEDGSILLQADA